MGVARQISQHCLRSAEWLLGVDDTLGIAQRLSAPRCYCFASGVGGVGLSAGAGSGRRKPSPEQAQDKGRNGTAAVRRPFYLMRCTLVEVGPPRKILQRKRMSAVRGTAEVTGACSI